jgi:hypothetical protein
MKHTNDNVQRARRIIGRSTCSKLLKLPWKFIQAIPVDVRDFGNAKVDD